METGNNNLEQELKYHKTQRLANYLGALLCLPAVIAAGSITGYTSHPQIYNEGYAGMLGFAALASIISATIGISKSINDSTFHDRKIGELERKLKDKKKK